MAVTASSPVCRVLLLLNLIDITEAGEFLSNIRGDANATMSFENTLLEEIEDTLGGEYRTAIEARLPALEKVLLPMFTSFPKNKYDRFDQVAVRYGLHRLFTHKHAWSVDGLAPTGDDVNRSAIAIMFNKSGPSRGPFAKSELISKFTGVEVPEHLQGMFESRLGHSGLDVEEVAMLAAIVEHLAATEATMRLEHAYEVDVIEPKSCHLTADEVDQLVDTYMSVYLLNINLTRFTNRSQLLKVIVNKSYPGWEDIQKLVRQTRHKIAGGRPAFCFADIEAIVHAIGDVYGRWQDKECRDLKASLLNVEDDGTGRVSLDKFYDAALNGGMFQFRESAAFLRQIGALDESNPENPRVIVPNYILSPSNCIAASSYYSVCCIDECEDLLSTLEREVGAPQAPVNLITEIVTALPAAYTPLNRVLSPTLLRRLSDIAGRNGGMVPLHGRLFAQWMHHAYPRECPYPHVSGTTKIMTKIDFQKDFGRPLVASNDEMHQVLMQKPRIEKMIDGEDVAAEVPMWDDEEEFFVTHRTPEHISFMGVVCRCVAVLSVAVSMLYSLYQMCGDADMKIEKFI